MLLVHIEVFVCSSVNNLFWRVRETQSDESSKKHHRDAFAFCECGACNQVWLIKNGFIEKNNIYSICAKCKRRNLNIIHVCMQAMYLFLELDDDIMQEMGILVKTINYDRICTK
ncbi:hypothetical protein Glove_329g62 [Diversispora epigaea]|uniref:Uncharacterized protein n=1 Tax=Diversispora epigaea TaxID=1348612 RepID=A0A397HQA7_9GLOM|nr:hypothetical protein Glove_329g62 [Diversispora epigaea]